MHKQGKIIINLHKSGISKVAIAKQLLNIIFGTVWRVIKHCVELESTADSPKSSSPRTRKFHSIKREKIFRKPCYSLRMAAEKDILPKTGRFMVDDE